MAWIVDEPGVTLAAFLKARTSVAWSVAKRQIAAGKVFVDGVCATAVDLRLAAGQTVELRAHAQRPRDPDREGVLVHDDAHVVVIDKPSGVNSVPYEDRETGTAMDLVRDAWRQRGRRATVTPLYIVHRLDKDTSGLLCFAKTRLAERGLHTIFQRHQATREYLAVAEGRVESRRIESTLVADRGDGIRGSTRHAGQGQHAVTFVEVIKYGDPQRVPMPPREGLRSGKPSSAHAIEVTARATLCRVRLETGRTHQIRIHLSEAGHPLVGETVYIRDLLRAGRTPLPAARLMLHAATLGFIHPVTGAQLDFRCEPPADFADILGELGLA